MTKGKRTTAFALAGAIVLASGAYALGSQASDGAAVAAKQGEPAGSGHGFGRGPGMRPGFDALADRLGVDEADLRAALEDIAADRKAELADALGIDAAKVEQAFEDARPDRHRMRAPQAFAAALAKELGLSAEQVRAALGKHRGDLAAELAVSEEKLREAFHAVIGKVRPHRPRFGNLAEELGVTQAQLDAAFEKLHDQFAQELAGRLKLDAAKVQDALDALQPPHFRRP